MSWVKVDDKFPDHRKVMRAAGLVSPHGYSRVVAVWLQGTCYTSRSESDGFIPLETVKRFHDAAPLKVAAAFVTAGLWEPKDGGYLVHDYTDYNPTAAEQREKRSKDSARKKRVSIPTDSEGNPERSREGDGIGSVESPVSTLIRYYHEQYLQRFGEKPQIHGDKDGKLLKTLEKTHGVDAVKRRIDGLLTSSDEFIVKSGRTIGVLSACWNKLGGPLRPVVGQGPGQRVQGCRHTPPCTDAAAHTKRDLTERRTGIA